MHMKLVFKNWFHDSGPFLFLKERLLEAEALDLFTGFEHPVIEERVYPELIFKEPQSIIAIALAYPSKLKEAPVSKKELGEVCLPELLGELITIPFCEKN